MREGRLAERLLLRFGVVHKYKDAPGRIPPSFPGGQRSLGHGADGAQKPRLIDEWDQNNTLPVGPLPLRIDQKVNGVKVCNRGVKLCHQVPVRLRQKLAARRWLDSHELLVRQERPARRKCDVD